MRQGWETTVDPNPGSKLSHRTAFPNAVHPLFAQVVAEENVKKLDGLGLAGASFE